MTTNRELYNGHCCPDDPECEHSFMEMDEAEAHLNAQAWTDPDHQITTNATKTEWCGHACCPLGERHMAPHDVEPDNCAGCRGLLAAARSYGTGRVPHQNFVDTALEIERARRVLNDLLMLQGERLARSGDFAGSDQCLALVDMTKFDGPIGTFAGRWR